MKRGERLKEFMCGTSGRSPEPMMISQPLIIMFRQDDGIVCHIHPTPKDDYRTYGLLVCDLVRHLARAFKVDEDDVWEWVDKERNHPTTAITNPS